MMEEKKSSPVVIAAAWLLVLLPLSWGVYQSGKNAAKLFTAPPAPQAPAR